MKASKIKYYPLLSVKENAKKNNCSEASIRLYIKENNIDRRGMEKARKIEICREYYKKHKDSTRHKMSVEKGISMSWISTYWDYITTDKEFTFFDNKKSKINKLEKSKNYFQPHPSVIRDILKEEEFTESIAFPQLPNEKYSLIALKYGHSPITNIEEIPSRVHDFILMPNVTEDIKALLTLYLKSCKSKLALLLPITFLSGESRYKAVFSKFPLEKVLIYIEDVNIEKKEIIEGAVDEVLSSDNYAWFIFKKGFSDSPSIRWIHNDQSLLFVDGDTKETEILDGIKFYPTIEFKRPIKDVIQFHSLALPENRVLSNHYNCIIKFRGIEFHGLEQLFMSLTYSNSPSILTEVMKAKSCQNAKSIGSHIDNAKRDWDFCVKQYRIIALCHLYKYLSCKEYRDRLRELKGQTLVECPNGNDTHFACVQNLETNLLEGNNCSGRTTMIVRDMMLELEEKAIREAQIKKGSKLTKPEEESILEMVYEEVRKKFDNDTKVIKDSELVLDFIAKNKIPIVKRNRPKPFNKVEIDLKSRCLVLDFDNTIFDTSIDSKFRKVKGKKNWKKIYSLIPKYNLYEGWKEVFDWLKANNIKIGILSGASTELIRRTLDFYKIPYDAIVGWQTFYEKPNPILGNMLMDKLKVRESQIIYIGDSIEDEVQARASKFRYVAALWDSKEEEAIRKVGCEYISNPKDIINLFK